MNKYKNGDIVTGCVTGIEKYGIFINIDERYNGLIHISEISNSFVRNIYDFVKIGEIIQARVIEEDIKNSRIKLSIKDLDYRISNKKNTRIKETEAGFTTLGNMLNTWINEKNEELTKKIKKN